MTLTFLDSSSLAKLFILENGTVSLTFYLSRFPGRRQVISQLAILEVRSALQRRMRRGEISRQEYLNAFDSLQGMIGVISVIAIERVIVETASDLIGRHALRSLDAIQLATAIITRDELDPADTLLFIASDHKLLTAAAAEGLTTWDPADPIQPPPIV